MIGIINYGMGNLSSVKNALDYLTIPNTLVNHPDEINSCSKLILPGGRCIWTSDAKFTRIKIYR